MSIEDGVRSLAEGLVRGDGVHQAGTLTPGKVRVLAALHYLGRPCSYQDLANAIGQNQNHIYRLANELVEQGILVLVGERRRSALGRAASLYQCICSTTQEEER